MFFEIKIAVIAFVFSELLITDGNIFAFYGRWIENLEGRGLDWLSMPLGGCPKCLAGQLALWGYLFRDGYTVSGHLISIVFAIFFTEIIVVLYGKIQMQ